MTIADILLPEFDREMALTRRLLERVPDGRGDWKPHPRSMALGRLTEHLVDLPTWARETIERDSLDASVGQPVSDQEALSRGALLARFDQHCAAARAALVGRSNAELMAPWTLRVGGKTLFTMPKATVLRAMVLNHLIHHRGQLTVYLRMHDVALPSMYGPSGDEEDTFRS